VTGGYVYRGSALPPRFRGRYFVADSQDSRIGSVGLSVNPATGMATVTDVLEHTAELGGSGFLAGPVSFARDLAGELYLCTFGGRVLRIVGAGAPNAPRSLSSASSGRTVTLTWQAPSGGAVPGGYLIEVGSSPGMSNLLVSPLGAQLSAAATDVPNGVYYVRVRATANGVIGPPSNEIVVTMAIGGCTGPPAAPGNLVRSGSGSTVTLTWGAVAGATGYVIEAGSASGLANLAQAATSVTSATATAPAGTYYVRVRATNACGISAASPEIVVTVP
jgi:hypothetical protein